MDTGRVLPEKRNPIFEAEATPDHEELISRRRLGQTMLQSKPGTVGVINATQPENLGKFEYAHLKVPLPENLEGSEIFSAAHPEAYFLMRRSKDGYVSATGMFKATYPWASNTEEQTERTYHKSLPSKAQNEVAGNVWVTESAALELAQDYGIVPWIVALLDTAAIHAEDKKAISPPPKYKFTANDRTMLPPPLATPRGRGRPRASSPSKKEKVTSPRKRLTKAAKEADAADAKKASQALNEALNAAADADSRTSDSTLVNGDVEKSMPERSSEKTPAEKKSSRKSKKDLAAEGETVTVSVHSAVEHEGDVETTHTTVSVQMPAGSPDLPFPENTEEMIAKAKEMVDQAKKLEGESSQISSKRKADVLDDEEDDDGDAVNSELQPVKKARLMEQEVRREKVRNRALIGVAASLAIGALIPYVLGG